MFKQNINIFVAMAMVAAFGIGASYLIVGVSNSTNFSYLSTDDSIIITAEFQKPGGRSAE